MSKCNVYFVKQGFQDKIQNPKFITMNQKVQQIRKKKLADLYNTFCLRVPIQNPVTLGSIKIYIQFSPLMTLKIPKNEKSGTCKRKIFVKGSKDYRNIQRNFNGLRLANF